MILLRKPWRTQPQTPASASAWALSRGLSHLGVGAYRYDAATRALATDSVVAGTLDTKTTPTGLGREASSGGASSEQQTRDVFGRNGWTAIIIGNPSASGQGWWLAHGNAAVGGIAIGHNFDRSFGTTPGSGTLCVTILQTGVQRNGANAASAVDGNSHVWIVRYAKAGTPRMWRDGVELTVTNPNSDAFTQSGSAATDIFRRFGNELNGAYQTIGPITGTAVFQTVLNDAECAAFRSPADAWGLLFAPRRIIIPVAGAGGDVSVALTGQAATASAGTATVSSTVPTSGQASTVSAGTLAPTTSVAVTGQAATVSAGTTAPVISPTLSGQAVTSSAGTQGVSVTVALSGQAVTASAGTITYTTSGDVTVALSGQAVTVSAGSLVPDVSRTLSGQALSVLAGTAGPQITVGVTGQSATASAGTLVASGGSNVVYFWQRTA